MVYPSLICGKVRDIIYHTNRRYTHSSVLSISTTIAVGDFSGPAIKHDLNQSILGFYIRWSSCMAYVCDIWACSMGLVHANITHCRDDAYVLRSSLCVRWPWLYWIVTGLSSNFLAFEYYHDMVTYIDRFEYILFQLSSAWGWMVFGTNTLITGFIIARIVYVLCSIWLVAIANIIIHFRYVTRCAGQYNAVKSHNKPYAVLLEAIIESALVTWISLLLYGISCLAPQGHITVSFIPC